MKRIVLSFDDARSDFYTRAFPLLQKHRAVATLNVITGYLADVCTDAGLPETYMTAAEVKECCQAGIEIASHGHRHVSEQGDLLQSLDSLNELGVQAPIGFASPYSELTLANRNQKGVWGMCQSGRLAYVRSGFQIRREGLVYTAVAVLDSLLHWPCLYRWLHKRAVITRLSERFLPSATIFSYTTNRQLESFIDAMPHDSAVILMFHSVLQPGDTGYLKDKFCWDAGRFDRLLHWLKANPEVEVVTTRDMVDALVK